jgi:hypothetical protein
MRDNVEAERPEDYFRKSIANIFGVFHVKNHDFTPKKSYSFQLRRAARKLLGYFV